jgi:hypothetical protein
MLGLDQNAGFRSSTGGCVGWAGPPLHARAYRRNFAATQVTGRPSIATKQPLKVEHE